MVMHWTNCEQASTMVKIGPTPKETEQKQKTNTLRNNDIVLVPCSTVYSVGKLAIQW